MARQLKSSGLRRFIGISLILFFVFCISNLYCEELNYGNYSNFKQFLSADRPPIAYLKLSRSGFFYPKTNEVEYEVSIQPNTYYIKELGSLFETNQNEFSVSGISFSDKWYIDEHGQVSVLNLDPKISGIGTPPEKYISGRKTTIEEVLALGIFQLDREAMAWSGDTFSSQTKMPDQFGTVSGRIIGGDGTRPDAIEYHFSKKDITYNVKYEYNYDGKRPVWMPYKTILNFSSPRFTPYQNSLHITNVFEELIIGLTNIGPLGYVYQNFIPEGDLITNGNLIIYSNGVGNILLGNHFEEVHKASGVVEASAWDLRVIRIVLFSSIIIGFVVFGWYLTQSRPKQK